VRLGGESETEPSGGAVGVATAMATASSEGAPAAPPPQPMEELGPALILRLFVQGLMGLGLLAIAASAVAALLDRRRHRAAALGAADSARASTPHGPGHRCPEVLLQRGEQAMAAARMAEAERRTASLRAKVVDTNSSPGAGSTAGGAGPAVKPPRSKRRASARATDGVAPGFALSASHRDGWTVPVGGAVGPADTVPTLRQRLPWTQSVRQQDCPLPFSQPPRYMPAERSASAGAGAVRHQQDLAYMISLAQDVARVSLLHVW